MVELKKLYAWLKANSHYKAAQQVQQLSDEWAEPWHEEVVKEYGDEIPEEDIPEEKDVSLPHGMEAELDYDTKHFEDVLLVLKKEGLPPISTSGGSAVLGSGAYGVAVKTIYNGMPAVVKAIIDPPDNEADDIGAWKKIIDATKSMPPEFAKHVPAIYYMNKGSIKRDDDWYGDINYEVIVMEELYPLNKSMEMLFRGYNKKQFDSLFMNEDYLYKVAQTIVNTIVKKSKNEGMRDVPNINVSEIFKLINGKTIDSRDMTQDIMHYLRSNHSDILYYVPDEYLEIRIKNDIRQNMSAPEAPADWFAHLTRKDGSFEEGPFFSHFWESIPETGMFFKTLISLAKNFNIGWADLAPRNIMMDKDGNLKIIDVGLYEEIAT